MSAEALRKGVIYGRWVRAGRETGPSRRRWYIVDQTRLNPCWERPFGLHNELEPEVKMEIPAKTFEGTPQPSPAVPRLGEHNAYVLGEILGLSAEE